jgi:dTMP kinase
MIYTMSIPGSRPRAGRLDLGEVKRDLVEGLTFVKNDRQVRPWLLGIAFTFTAAGGVFSLGVGFVKDVLGGGDTGFAFLIGFLGLGMILGLLSVGVIAKRVPKDVMFSASLITLGFALVALASMNGLGPAIPIAAALGFCGGGAYSTGYSLIGETTRDDLRGRTFSAAYTVIRIGTLVGLGFFPLFAGAIGDNTLTLPFATLDLPGSRVTLWLAGLVATGGGLLSMRAIGHRRGTVSHRDAGGYLVAFEGGEGAGKSTQIASFVEWLEDRGVDFLTTREPGGTEIGNRIRDLLLDKDIADMDPRSEALLYAADRAQHVAEVIRPALEAGKVVVSDRFVDSSLAYQGIARGLGVDEIYQISEWATGGMVPDLVFYLKLDHKAGLARAGDDPDRLEKAGDEFHAKVSSAYLQLAKKFPDRFVILDASRSKEAIHEDIIRAYGEHVSDEDELSTLTRDLGPPGPPMPR